MNGNAFLKRNHEGNKVLAQYFSSAKEKNYQSTIICPPKISCSNETDIKTIKRGKIKTICCQRHTSKHKQENSLDRKKIIKEEVLEHMERKKTW